MTAVVETDIAEIIKVTTKRYGRDVVRTVLVRCPFCGKRHTHGWPIGSCAPGYRISHCDKGPHATYYIPAPKG
jgi:hypothetical protein